MDIKTSVLLLPAKEWIFRLCVQNRPIQKFIGKCGFVLNFCCHFKAILLGLPGEDWLPLAVEFSACFTSTEWCVNTSHHSIGHLHRSLFLELMRFPRFPVQLVENL